MSDLRQFLRVPRRQFLRASTTLAAATLFPRASWARSGHAQSPAHTSLPTSVDPHFLLDDPAWHAFAQRGLDAAHQAGAQYADVRLTRTLTQQHYGPAMSDREILGIGIRALVNGCWGFASSPYWHGDESVSLGKMAAQQARAVARVTPNTLTLSPRPVASGRWIMPVTTDPFSLPMEEKRDFLLAWLALVTGYQSSSARGIETPAGWGITFVRQEQALATSDGSYVTQVVYRTRMDAPIRITMSDGESKIEHRIQRVDESGAGWEYLLEAKVPDQIPALVDEAVELWKAPRKPAEPGRVAVVFDAATAARLVDQSIGMATELDRALGDEANASGTSFLGPDIAAMLGQQVGAPSISIVGDRRMTRGLASVNWDAEGVEPDVVTLVNNGVLQDYQTTRPIASPLADWYAKRGIPVRSHGCATAASALDVTLQTPPNLTVVPGKGDASFQDLVASVPNGLAVLDADVTTDFQAKHGLVKGGIVREIKNGKLGAWIQNPGFIFETTELWKNITALGGAASAVQFPMWRGKGEPAQRIPHTVRTVPMLAKNVAVIDVMNR